MTELTRKDFSFDLPEHLVAHEALAERDKSRMLVRAPNGALSDRSVSDLPSILPRGTLLLLNNTKVFPSRLTGTLESGGKVEVFLLEKTTDGQSSTHWIALGKPFRKFRAGRRLIFSGGLEATITGLDTEAQTPTVSLNFAIGSDEFAAWLDKNGIIPLPPYIRRDNPVAASESKDKVRYQTVYAKDTGSVAAPTAGLHMTPTLMKNLSEHGVEIQYVCLHVGAGTFLPVKAEDIASHKMHAEKFSVPTATLRALQAAKNAKRPVFAVGTTTFRTLESLYRSTPDLLSKDPELLGDRWHSTDLFVYPKTKNDRYHSRVFDGILTNFHQPESTLLMLISALIGLNEVRDLYRHAIENEYRFYSYGDCCLLTF